MNRDEIVKLAKECTAPEWWDEGMDRYHMGMDFIAFAASIRAATKEEDARICEDVSLQAVTAWKLAYQPQDQGREMGADECAHQIRASK